MSLREPRRDRAYSCTRDQLDAHFGARVDLFQVVDELRNIFDGIDVVMRRRRDERHARHGTSQGCDLVGHLVSRQLPAFAGFRPLRHFDLDLGTIVEILRRDPEAS